MLGRRVETFASFPHGQRLEMLVSPHGRKVKILASRLSVEMLGQRVVTLASLPRDRMMKTPASLPHDRMMETLGQIVAMLGHRVASLPHGQRVKMLVSPHGRKVKILASRLSVETLGQRVETLASIPRDRMVEALGQRVETLGHRVETFSCSVEMLGRMLETLASLPSYQGKILDLC